MMCFLTNKHGSSAVCVVRVQVSARLVHVVHETASHMGCHDDEISAD
jgi:hypothetical protein